MADQEFLNSLFSLDGRIGIITGASGGLGFAMAETCAHAGATVFALSRSGGADQAFSGGGSIVHKTVDVTDRIALAACFDECTALNGLDFLINNAGITEKAPAATFTEEAWQRIQKCNVDAVHNCCQLAYPYLKQSPFIGRIVNVTSMAAHLGFEGVAPYCASKAAVLGLTRGLAVEWAQDNILVNSIAPGWFPSNMTRGVMDEDRQAKILARMPLHRFGNPEELAAAALFLLSTAAQYINGHDLAVDGGALAYGY